MCRCKMDKELNEQTRIIAPLDPISAQTNSPLISDAIEKIQNGDNLLSTTTHALHITESKLVSKMKLVFLSLLGVAGLAKIVGGADGPDEERHSFNAARDISIGYVSLRYGHDFSD